MSIAFIDTADAPALSSPQTTNDKPQTTRPNLSEARLNANRTNAQKSTGPRSETGKLRSAQNSLKHGFHSLSPLLPGECQTDFDNLVSELRAEHRPQTATQSHLLHQIACA